MPKALYTPAQLAFLKKEYPRKRIPELTAAFNRRFRQQRTEKQIHYALKNHRIRAGRRGGFNAGSTWLVSAQQFKALEAMYQKYPRKELAERFNARFGLNLKLTQVIALVKNHKMRCSRTGRFQKGHVPWSAGLKGKGVMKPNSGTWRKGHTPPHYCPRPLGFERLSKDGYIEVKVAERNPHTGGPVRFRMKHVVIWEKAHGKVPPGMCLRFKDGNKANCKLKNLELVSRRVNALLNKRHKYGQVPDQFKPTVMLVAKLEAKAGERSKGVKR